MNWILRQSTEHFDIKTICQQNTGHLLNDSIHTLVVAVSSWVCCRITNLSPNSIALGFITPYDQEASGEILYAERGNFLTRTYYTIKRCAQLVYDRYSPQLAQMEYRSSQLSFKHTQWLFISQNTRQSCSQNTNQVAVACSNVLWESRKKLSEIICP